MSLLYLGLKSSIYLATNIETSDNADLDNLDENEKKKMVKYFIRAYQDDVKQDWKLYTEKIKIFDTALILVGIMLSLSILSLLDYIFMNLF